MTETLLNRLLAKVEFTSTCWLWTASKDRLGYGHIGFGKAYRTMNGKRRCPHVFAHRALYEICCGSVPTGMELDHLCRNPSCVNPDHLQPVSHRINVLRGTGAPARASRKTHCPQGHPYSGENLWTNGRHRLCRECDRIRKRAA